MDCSDNGYFCTYLTEDGKLYGMGANIVGLLGNEEGKSIRYYAADAEKIVSPKLLMEDVLYARAGRECITALKTDGSVWWWGQYLSTYLTNSSLHNNSGSGSERMIFDSPRKILDGCVYATTGDWTGAALTKEGDLYTWGLNIFGECGLPVSNDDYVRTPQKVLENVQMVWPETAEFDSASDELTYSGDHRTDYIFNTFVLMENGDILSAGKNLGEQEKTISLSGDREYETTHRYSDTFVPIRLEEYSEEKVSSLIQKLEIGTDRSDVEQYIMQNGMYYSYDTMTDGTGDTEADYSKMVIENYYYFLYFDKEGHLSKIVI